MTLKSSAPAPSAQLAANRPRSGWRVLAFGVALTLLVGLAGCGRSDGPSPEESARLRQAAAELEDFGLTSAQARCVAERLGADTVLEAPAMDILASGQPYQDAAKACIR